MMKHHQVRDVTQQEVCLLQEVAAQEGVEHFLFPASVLIGGNRARMFLLFTGFEDAKTP